MTIPSKIGFSALGAAFVITLSAGTAAQPAGPAAPAPAAAPVADAQQTSTFDQLLEAEIGTGGGLTADEVAERAATSSPTVRGRNEDLLAAAAEVDRAARAYTPVVQLTARYTRLSDTGGGSVGNLVVAPGEPAGPIAPGAELVNVPLGFETPLNQYAFQASLLVPVSDYFLRIGPGHDGAKLRESAAKENVAASKLRAAADARLTYYSWVRARLSEVVAKQSFELARAHLTDAQSALAAGTASPADVARVESEVARSELLVASSQNLSELTEEQMRTAMHDESDRPYRIGEDVRRRLGFADAGLRELWAEGVANRPELKALDRERAGLEQSVAAEKAGYGPRLELFGNAAYSNPNQRVFPQEAKFRGSWDAGVQVVWQISDAPAAGARVRAAEARARALAAERDAVVDGIRLEVMSAWQARAQARVAEGTTARGLAASEESYRARRLLFQNGRATTVELLDAETELTRARLDALGARIDARVAEVRLGYAVGRVERSAPQGGRRTR